VIDPANDFKERGCVESCFGEAARLPNYLLIGTVHRPDWKRGTHTSMGADEMIDCLHDFKDVLHFELAPRWIRPK